MHNPRFSAACASHAFTCLTDAYLRGRLHAIEAVGRKRGIPWGDVPYVTG